MSTVKDEAPRAWRGAADDVMQQTNTGHVMIQRSEAWEFRAGMEPMDYRVRYHVVAYVPGRTISGSGETVEEAVADVKAQAQGQAQVEGQDDG
jgi:hypothetical protein